MRELARISRRLFGQSLGATVALTFLSKPGFDQFESVEVKINKFAFEPNSLTIKRGISVQWINLDSAPHTATSIDDIWDTGGLAKHQAGFVTFHHRGTFQYFCAYHPHMKGQVIVVD